MAKEACTLTGHKIRVFNYKRDLQNLKDICANVYGGTDYMPRIIHRIAADPGVLVLAAEAVSGAHGQHQEEQIEEADPEQQQAGEASFSRSTSCIDGIICGERRGQAVWLYGLRVREGVRGRGLGHQLMEAIVRWAPQLLAAAPDAHPPPPRPAAQVGSAPAPAQSPPDVILAQTGPAVASSWQSGTPRAAATPHATSASTGCGGPIRHVVTCTVTYNAAAQRIIGRQLPGPLYEVEVWPGQPLMEAYEAAAGWVRGVGLPPGAPCMLRWIPGVQQALEADVEAQALLPRWRRVARENELHSAVAHLLYGRSGGGSHHAAGSGSATAAAATPGPSHDLNELLWLPMPYDLWPLESAFVQRELAAGNIWLLTAPSRSEPPVEEQPAVDQWDPRIDRGGGGGCNGLSGGGAFGGALEVEEGNVVAVMVLTHFETLSRVCAGIIARNNAAVHAAVAYAAQLQPHFWVSALRVPAGCRQPPGDDGHRKGWSQASAAVPAGAAAEQPDVEPLPAMYEVAGGHRGVLMYGGIAPTWTQT